LTTPGEYANRLYGRKPYNNAVWHDLAQHLLLIDVTTTPKPYPYSNPPTWIAFFLLKWSEFVIRVPHSPSEDNEGGFETIELVGQTSGMSTKK
jgi:hypothetical protein